MNEKGFHSHEKEAGHPAETVLTPMACNGCYHSVTIQIFVYFPADWGLKTMLSYTPATL